MANAVVDRMREADRKEESVVVEISCGACPSVDAGGGYALLLPDLHFVKHHDTNSVAS